MKAFRVASVICLLTLFFAVNAFGAVLYLQEDPSKCIRSILCWVVINPNEGDVPGNVLPTAILKGTNAVENDVLTGRINMRAKVTVDPVPDKHPLSEAHYYARYQYINHDSTAQTATTVDLGVLSAGSYHIFAGATNTWSIVDTTIEGGLQGMIGTMKIRVWCDGGCLFEIEDELTFFNVYDRVVEVGSDPDPMVVPGDNIIFLQFSTSEWATITSQSTTCIPQGWSVTIAELPSSLSVEDQQNGYSRARDNWPYNFVQDDNGDNSADIWGEVTDKWHHASDADNVVVNFEQP